MQLYIFTVIGPLVISRMHPAKCFWLIACVSDVRVLQENEQREKIKKNKKKQKKGKTNKNRKNNKKRNKLYIYINNKSTISYSFLIFYFSTNINIFNQLTIIMVIKY